jgi:hypothetical protein
VVQANVVPLVTFFVVQANVVPLVTFFVVQANVVPLVTFFVVQANVVPLVTFFVVQANVVPLVTFLVVQANVVPPRAVPLLASQIESAVSQFVEEDAVCPFELKELELPVVAAWVFVPAAKVIIAVRIKPASVFRFLPFMWVSLTFGCFASFS